MVQIIHNRNLRVHTVPWFNKSNHILFKSGLHYNNNELSYFSFTFPAYVPFLSLVVVYNCGVGSWDCSQCWGREDQGHLCGWCDNSCRPRDDCQPIRDQCPAPEIYKVRSGFLAFYPFQSCQWLLAQTHMQCSHQPPCLHIALSPEPGFYSRKWYVTYPVTWCGYTSALAVRCQLMRVYFGRRSVWTEVSLKRSNLE